MMTARRPPRRRSRRLRHPPQPGYTGDKNDTAAMNIWLHKQVMQKLAENGGVVPPDLLK